MSEKKEMSFEEKLARLSQIVEEVEGNALPLEKSLKLYEEGKALIKELNDTLLEAENKLKDVIVVESE